MSEFYYSCSESEVNTVHYILIQRNYKFIPESILGNYRKCQDAPQRNTSKKEKRKKALLIGMRVIAPLVGGVAPVLLKIGWLSPESCEWIVAISQVAEKLLIFLSHFLES